MSDDALYLCQHGNAEEVSFLIDFFLWECEITQAPSVDQVTQWETVLRQRGGKYIRYAQLCADWIQHEKLKA